MKIHKEILEYVLPEKTFDYFDAISLKKEGKRLIITLEEKSVIPEIPEEYRGRRIVSKGFRNFSLDDFPIRRNTVTLLLRRRVWKVEGVKKILKRDIPIAFPGTHLEKEFADFLKGGD